MRKVIISESVMGKIVDLRIYLVEQLKLSREAAHRRTDRMNAFLLSLANEVDYPLCRFKQWKSFRYRCVPFEKDWIFAYEVFDDGIIVRDMSHAKLLKE